MSGLVRDVWGRPASHIAERLWQSGFPTPFRALPTQGVDLVVLLAREAQPDGQVAWVKKACPSLSILAAPLDDTEDPEEVARIVAVAKNVAKRVAEYLRRGKRVLVTCAVGRNRSGLVSALTLMEVFGVSGREAIARVREQRNPDLPKGEGALTNRAFVKALESMPAKKNARKLG